MGGPHKSEDACCKVCRHPHPHCKKNISGADREPHQNIADRVEGYCEVQFAGKDIDVLKLIHDQVHVLQE